MEIKDYNFLSFSNNYEKSHYFNNLIIQEQKEYHLHYFSDLDGSFRINKIKYHISSGSFFITYPGDHYSITSIKAVRTLSYFIILMKLNEGDGGFIKFIESVLIKRSFLLNSNQRMVLEEIFGRMNSENLYKKESVRHHLMAFLYDLPEYQRQTQTHNYNHRYIEKAVKFMHERVYEELMLAELCRYLCISEPHCIRLFKSSIGTTPMKYFTRIKIEEAITQLLTSNKPLALIAEELNFSSAAHFSKTFKQYLSISPTQYRSNYINTLEHRQKMSIKEQEKAYNLLQNIIDASPDLIFFKDTNGILMGGNKAICDLLGKTKEQLIGKTDYEIFSKEAADSFQKRDEMIFKNNRPIKNEEVMSYTSGRKRTFEVYKAPFHDDQGKILGLIGISRDITDRINTRKALEAAKSEQNEIFAQDVEVMTSISEKLLELLKDEDYSNTNSQAEVLQLRLLTEGLYSFIHKLFKTPAINNRGTDSIHFFDKLKTLLYEVLPVNIDETKKMEVNFRIPTNLPEIVFIDDRRMLRALFFLIRAISINVDRGILSFKGKCENNLLKMQIRITAPKIPERKQKKIEKLLQREEGSIFFVLKEDPIELCMANMELDLLKSRIRFLINTSDVIEIEVLMPFPSGIESLNEYYFPKE